MQSSETFTADDIDAVLWAFEARNPEQAAAHWADDGVFIDPHYPETEYRGRQAIADALAWALDTIVAQPDLTVRRRWGQDGDFAVEVETTHTMQDGTEADFRQVFIVETQAGEITRWQSYLPYPPPDA